VEGCIAMKEIETGKPILSWNDRVRRERQEAGIAYTPSLWEKA